MNVIPQDCSREFLQLLISCHLDSKIKSLCFSFQSDLYINLEKKVSRNINIETALVGRGIQPQCGNSS